MPQPWADAAGPHSSAGTNVLQCCSCTFILMDGAMGRLSCFSDSYMPQGPEISSILSYCDLPILSMRKMMLRNI